MKVLCNSIVLGIAFIILLQNGIDLYLIHHEAQIFDTEYQLRRANFQDGADRFNEDIKRMKIAIEKIKQALSLKNQKSIYPKFQKIRAYPINQYGEYIV